MSEPVANTETELARMRKAIVQARNALWWFVERDTGHSWGWDDTDIEEICARAIDIQDRILAPALAADSKAGGDD